ncbi:alkaline phosphatase D family protein [Roseicella aerolata]|uniref:Alkaline phosphatase D family protein n=1 Tax=Roseicella aerolata TaxID=2883479 RepID=A0A9X1IC45_9PROT|nr:alkaline phosphatase D family protein [Roseicella aerolata]MCB4822105.1 alkaline phosphatase D family protein [Roseicella aerolata]
MTGNARLLLSAGDVDQDSAVLWAAPSAPGPVRFEIWATATPAAPLVRETVMVADPLVPARLSLADGTLEPGTRYAWRATDAEGATTTGRFVTPAAEGERAGFRMGVSGDWFGGLSPYPAIANADERGLDLFVKLGDTIYADIPSPAVPEPQATTLGQFRLKHREGYAERAGLDAWGDLQASTAILATIDDHEVTDNFAGGAPVPTGQTALYGAAAPTLVNDSPLYENALRSFHEYNAIEERRQDETGDARMAGEWDLYRYTLHGADAASFLLDARSFRDAPLRSWDLTPADAPRFLGESATQPRTLLGEDQLARLQADLLDAEARGVTWKFVLLPQPIQNLGPGDAQDRYEGYAFERNALLKFIDDQDIENVVFVAADIHGTVVNNLTYQVPGAAGPGPQIALPALEVTTGPVATDPPFGPLVIEAAARFGLLSAEQLALYRSLPLPAKEGFFQQVINGQLDLFGYDRLGLDETLDQARGLLSAKLTAGGWTATHSFGWSEFAVAEATGGLTVRTWGIPAYGAAEATDPAVAGRRPAVVSEFTLQPARAIEFSLAPEGEAMAALRYENGALPGRLQDSRSLTDTTGADLARFRQAGGDVTIRQVDLASGHAIGDGTAALARLAWTGDGEALLRREAGAGSLGTLRVEDFLGSALRIEGFAAVDLRLERPGDLRLRLEGVEQGEVVTGAGDDAITIGAARRPSSEGALLRIEAGSGNDRIEPVAAGPGHARLDLLGGTGEDTLLGGRASDTIDGGPGRDDLTGGGGTDIFVLRAGETEGDVIRDFRTASMPGGRDLLRLEGFGADAMLVHAGGDNWSINGETFRLAGVTRLGPCDVLLA